MKRWPGVFGCCLIFGWFSQAFSVPDSRDSVVLESKTTAPSNGPQALQVRVWITNKDTLAAISIVLEEKSLSGGAYATLAHPRRREIVFDVTVCAFTHLKGFPIANFDRYHSNSPDTFSWGGFCIPDDPVDCVPPNSSRRCLFDIKFDSVTVQSHSGQFQLDSCRISGTATVFVDRQANEFGVNFVKAIITVDSGLGDLNSDGVLSAADVVLMLNCVFLHQEPPAGKPACNVECRSCSNETCQDRCRERCSNALTLEDVKAELNAVFLAEPFPPC